MPLNSAPELSICAPSIDVALHIDNFSQALVDALDAGILVTDSNGAIILMNRIAREQLSTCPGIDLQKAIPELWEMMVDVSKLNKANTEFLLRHEGLTLQCRVNPLRLDKEQVGAVSIFAENSGFEEMALQMKSYQELIMELEAVINFSSEGLWICDAKAVVLRLNPASERIHNIKAEEVIGRNMVDLVAEGFIDKSSTLEVIRTGTVVNILQQRHGRKLIITGTPVFDLEGRMIRVVSSVRDITELDNLQRELEEQEALKDQLRHHMLEMQQVKLESQRVIARSTSMQKAMRQAIKVSAVDSSVLILGESGVGKGLLAELIHKNSRRAEKPLIRINCGAIPESLIESELFGYEKGAFTGAQVAGKPGYLELADDGTLFLDEIAELPLPSQVKLLRFLEDGRITRLGGTKSRNVNVRILAATHHDLEKMVGQGKFRLDLYYRLKVIPIYVPSIRERKDCILPLVQYYIEYFGKRNRIKKRLTRAALDALLQYTYPGNVRELMNICERLVVMSETALIDLNDLPSDIVPRAEETVVTAAHWDEEITLQEAVDRVERSLLVQAQERGSNQRLMAAHLGVNQSTIARKLKKHNLA
jgi:PAS domain S-box-containing protein